MVRANPELPFREDVYHRTGTSHSKLHAFCAYLKSDPESKTRREERFQGWTPSVARICSGSNISKETLFISRSALKGVLNIDIVLKWLWSCNIGGAQATVMSVKGKQLIHKCATELCTAARRLWNLSKMNEPGEPIPVKCCKVLMCGIVC